MVKIPDGSFMMGSPPNEEGSQANEQPQHRVDLKAFYLGQTEVTQAQYQVVMGKNPSEFKGLELPVEQISWLDAKEFCQKISQKTGKIYDLPSESQWEYACRARTTSAFAFGDSIITDAANYNGSSIHNNAPKGDYRKETTNVNTFPPNSFGLFDIHGNVWEWCEDSWHENYQGAPVNGKAWEDKDVKPNDKRILRGGDWFKSPYNCRAAGRFKWLLSVRNNGFGFRIMCPQDF
jgi:formylglycine-generating enzyme required for sulfatase activity